MDACLAASVLTLPAPDPNRTVAASVVVAVVAVVAVEVSVTVEDVVVVVAALVVVVVAAVVSVTVVVAAVVVAASVTVEVTPAPRSPSTKRGSSDELQTEGVKRDYHYGGLCGLSLQNKLNAPSWVAVGFENVSLSMDSTRL